MATTNSFKIEKLQLIHKSYRKAIIDELFRRGLKSSKPKISDPSGFGAISGKLR
jgi:hypothetical protein